MYSTDMQTWKEATDQTKLFDDNALWGAGLHTGGLSEDCKRRQSALKYEAGFSKNYTSNRGKKMLTAIGTVWTII